jgi:mRNA interferase RelE/StbE
LSAALAWTIVYSEPAKKSLAKMDVQLRSRLTEFLRERVAKLENPRSLGQALQGSKFGEYWRYRVGDYRIICEIQDKKLIVLVLRIGHRREIYR